MMLTLSQTTLADFKNTSLTDKELAEVLNCTPKQIQSRRYNLIEKEKRKQDGLRFKELISEFAGGKTISEVANKRKLTEQVIIEFLQANKHSFFVNLQKTYFCSLNDAAKLLQAMQDGLQTDKEILKATKVHRVKLTQLRKVMALRHVVEYLISDAELSSVKAVKRYLNCYEIINIKNIDGFLYNRNLFIDRANLAVILYLLVADGATLKDAKILRKAPNDKEFRSIGELARAVING